MLRSKSSAPYHNPALREELLTAKPYVIPPRVNESLLNWIEASGKFTHEFVENLHDQTTAVELDEILGETIDEPEEEEGWGMDD
jgi:hypothetical protein